LQKRPRLQLGRAHLVRPTRRVCRADGVGWRAFVILDDADTEGVPLHEGCLPERPEYAWLEAQINTNHPQPRWARRLGEVDEKGLRFMRGPEGAESK